MRTTATAILFLALGLAACLSEPAENTDLGAKQATAQQRAEPLETPTLEASPPKAAETPAEYSLSVDPQVLPDGRVRLEVSSNIPGTIEVMAGLSLQGQADDDVWVGKNERVRLTNGRGVVTLATSDLPKGKYDAEASFHPRWGFQDSTSRATGISENLSASSSLTLAGSGESAAEVQYRENGQKWVMEHVAMGDPWRPAEWVQRFGQYRELPVNRGNPEILKAYYFPRIDTTLIVNTLKREITIWRLGRAHS